MKKFILFVLLAVFALTSTLTVDAATVKGSSRTAHFGGAQTVHISVHPRKHKKHKKHKKHHKRKKHRSKHNKNKKKN
jgi:Ni/Co efflux regulator RcnB